MALLLACWKGLGLEWVQPWLKGRCTGLLLGCAVVAARGCWLLRQGDGLLITGGVLVWILEGEMDLGLAVGGGCGSKGLGLLLLPARRGTARGRRWLDCCCGAHGLLVEERLLDCSGEGEKVMAGWITGGVAGLLLLPHMAVSYTHLTLPTIYSV